MKMIPEIIRAVHPTVSIKYTKIRRLFPISSMLGFSEIQYYSHSVFVVLPDWSLVRGRRISPDGSMSVFGMLGGLEITNGHEHLGQHGVTILMRPDTPILNMKRFGLDKYLLPHNLIHLLYWRF